MRLDRVVEAHKAVTTLEAQLAQAKEDRNRAIIEESEAGVSNYSIAKALGIAESTVGRIIKRSQS